MAGDKKSNIKVTKDGPLIANNLKVFKNSQDIDLDAKASMALCRCGKSEDKPFCDGTHQIVGFKGNKEYGRTPDRVKDYKGKELTIHDNRGVCAHVGYCTDNSPKVFDTSKRPWIDPDGDTPEKTKKTIRTCPSGALSYTHNQKKWIGNEREAGIKIHKDGPHCVQGEVELVDEDGNKPFLKEHYTLCRCGYSKNKPFCDGTHWSAKFSDPKN
jgi:CDGSH-type Zn-finger protein